MLIFDIERGGKQLSLELPVPMELLRDELRNIGIHEPLHNIPRTDFSLQPANKLGEHFMKLVRQDDSLQRIALACTESTALACTESTVLTREDRQALESLIINDSFSDIDQMNDYLRYGPATLGIRNNEPQLPAPPKPECPLIGANGFEEDEDWEETLDTKAFDAIGGYV